MLLILLYTMVIYLNRNLPYMRKPPCFSLIESSGHNSSVLLSEVQWKYEYSSAQSLSSSISCSGSLAWLPKYLLGMNSALYSVNGNPTGLTSIPLSLTTSEPPPSQVFNTTATQSTLQQHLTSSIDTSSDMSMDIETNSLLSRSHLK
jgi:hypothetical protein